MARSRSQNRPSRYPISAVAERFNVHPQTLRLYEREGLLRPSRTEGNTRIYSPEDLERLSVIITLTREMGVNLAGVEVILNMRQRMEWMQGEMGRLLKFLQEEIEKRREGLGGGEGKALIRVPPARLIRRPRRDGG